MIIHRSPLNDQDTQLYNIMCDIERTVYANCDRLMENFQAYVAVHGVPAEWCKMSTKEWYDHYNAIEFDQSEKSVAAKSLFRIVFGWDFFEPIYEKFAHRVEQIMNGAKKVWRWINTITSRALEAYRYANREALAMTGA